MAYNRKISHGINRRYDATIMGQKRTVDKEFSE
jgi:hypothetical protein